MDFESAVKEIRKDPNVNTIWFGFQTNRRFIFVVSPNSEFVPRDTGSFMISIDRGTEKKKSAKAFNLPESENIFEHARYVDTTAEDFADMM